VLFFRFLPAVLEEFAVRIRHAFAFHYKNNWFFRKINRHHLVFVNHQARGTDFLRETDLGVRQHKNGSDTVLSVFKHLCIMVKKPNYIRFAGIWSKGIAEEIRTEIRNSRRKDKRFSKERDKRLGLD
jgi:hypothetical protein